VEDAAGRESPTAARSPRPILGRLRVDVEIYLPEQVMIVFHADRPALVAHVSAGELRAGATGFVSWNENAAEHRETITIDTDIDGNPLPEPQQKAVIGWSCTPPGVFEAYRRIDGRRNGPLGSMWDPMYINQGIAIHGALDAPFEPASHGPMVVADHQPFPFELIKESAHDAIQDRHRPHDPYRAASDRHPRAGTQSTTVHRAHRTPGITGRVQHDPVR
jgi:hypothetical protein